MPYDQDQHRCPPAVTSPARRHALERGVTVVIPVRGRVRPLRTALASLREAAGRCHEPVEILIVDDSGPAGERLHRDNCARYGARYLRGPRHVGAKRNLAVSHGRYDLLFFTDSDCRPAADAIGHHVRRLRTAPGEVAAVAGPTLVEPAGTALFRLMSGSDLLNGDLERPARPGRLPWATTSNLAVRRDAFEAVGGFPEQSLTVVCGEDVDLGLRLTRQGYTIVSEPAAVTAHDSASTGSLATVLRRLFNYGRSEQWLADRYPEHSRVRWNPVSAVALATAATVAVRGRRGLAVLPLYAGAVLAVEAWRGGGRGDRSARAYGRAAARRLVEWSFDAGALTAAVQLRRPGLAFKGFATPQPEDDGAQ